MCPICYKCSPKGPFSAVDANEGATARSPFRPGEQLAGQGYKQRTEIERPDPSGGRILSALSERTWFVGAHRESGSCRRLRRRVQPTLPGAGRTADRPTERAPA